MTHGVEELARRLATRYLNGTRKVVAALTTETSGQRRYAMGARCVQRQTGQATSGDVVVLAGCVIEATSQTQAG